LDAVAVTNNAVVGAALAYVEANPAEVDAVRPLVILALHGPSVADRVTQPAHVTCGALAVTADWRVLQLRERPSGRWLFPGDHVRRGDGSLLGAALRDLTEQTGIVSNAVIPGAVTPFDIEAVAVSARRYEPEHVHFDVRFLVHVPVGPVRLPTGGALGHRWLPVADVPGRLGVKLRAAEVAASVPR
jgi:ADP-ribose pyrophosphatase YjhB (NUDIX family)